MSVLLFLGVLFVLVLVHELGHFAVAKWTGMRVDEFGIGFPPKLFGIRRGETEYTFNLFPIGGFVKIRGEDGVFLGEESHDDGFFTSKSKWAQAAVLVAGVTMNVLFAWILIAIAFGIGVQTSVSENEASPNAALAVTQVLPESPAALGQVTPGIVIRELSSGAEYLDALTPSSFSSFVAAHPDQALTLKYTLGGEEKITTLTPKKGIIQGDPEKAAVGVALTQIEVVSRSFTDSIIDATVYVGSSLYSITVGLIKLAYDAITFHADFSQVTGPVGIVGLVGEASAFGVTALLMFTAFISLNLAVINIFPFPALDGGRLLFVIIEAVKRSPINPKVAGTLNTIGFALLLLLMIAVTWSDISKIL